MIVLKRFLSAFCAAAMVAVMISLTACVSVQPVPDKAGRAAPFDVLGRVLVHYEGNAFTANVRWMHAADADEIFLMTPTGQTLAHMREDAIGTSGTTGATLTRADKTQYRATRVEALTKQGLGWELPMARLQHWIRGTPVPSYAFEILERDAAGKIRLLSQDGWKLSYDYYPATENEGLPRRMEVTGATQTLRLVIDTWRKEVP